MTDDIKAIRDALAAGPSADWSEVGLNHPDWKYISAVHPERIARLLDALAEAQKDAAIVRAQALEEAARHFDERDAGAGGYYMPDEPAQIIRAMKE